MILLDWLRRLIFGKNLNDIQHVFEQTENDLSDFMANTQMRREKLQTKIDRMAERHTHHGKQNDQAEIFHANLKVLRTKKIDHEEPVVEGVEAAEL